MAKVNGICSFCEIERFLGHCSNEKSLTNEYVNAELYLNAMELTKNYAMKWQKVSTTLSARWISTELTFNFRNFDRE